MYERGGGCAGGTARNKGRKSKERGQLLAIIPLTSVNVCLFSNFVVRVTVGIDRPVYLLKRHESMDQFIIGMEQ